MSTQDLSTFDTRQSAIDEGALVVNMVFEDVTVQDVMNVLKDYEKYSEFVEGTNKAEITKQVTPDGKVVDVFWNVTIASIKTVEYTLRLACFEDGISWSETDHGPFKKNRGGWKLRPTDDGKGVAFSYIILLEFNIWVPGFIKDFLVGKGLPKTLEAFKKRINEKKNENK
ncbi:hypothetical protein C9374_012035 [Naegleria lovaniensis]|uniref:Coenzyme Q-binding protein COQ10 START domain-containing protein n=1 Tax=Naegleria lovaniensis TaxID=51637 RepID=A0AA88GDH3_NAELO|nr:uncharacterized protein C9374_012035 [Naegleria lovaniensis]KAG2373572.1 hypothetical protein C9374_012035 [Naegleria lovaniensis]